MCAVVCVCVDEAGPFIEITYLDVCSYYRKGAFQSYRLGQYDTNPFKDSGIQALNGKQQQKPAGFVEEDHAARKARLEAAQDVYGLAPPALQKLDYTVHSQFRGDKYDILHDLRCKVMFKGSDILAGLKELGAMGVADRRLPSHFANVPSSATSVFNLTDADLQ